MIWFIFPFISPHDKTFQFHIQDTVRRIFNWNFMPERWSVPKINLTVTRLNDVENVPNYFHRRWRTRIVMHSCTHGENSPFGAINIESWNFTRNDLIWCIFKCTISIRDDAISSMNSETCVNVWSRYTKVWFTSRFYSFMIFITERSYGATLIRVYYNWTGEVVFLKMGKLSLGGKIHQLPGKKSK